MPSEDRQRQAIAALLEGNLEPGEKTLAVLPYASTAKRPRVAGEPKVKMGLWTTASRYRPLVLTNQRLLVFETGRTPYPRYLLEEFPVDQVRIVDFQRASMGRHTMVLALPDLGNVPFILGRYDQQDLKTFLRHARPRPRRGMSRRFTAALSLAAVLVTALVLDALNADLAIASLLLLLTVVAASMLGYLVGLVAALEAFVLLTYFFVAPRHSFAIDQPDDLIALVVFVAVSALMGTLVARLNELRARSMIAAGEAHLRLRVTSELRANTDPKNICVIVCDELVELFDLAACTLSFAGIEETSTGTRLPIGRLEVDNGALRLTATLGRPLLVHERATLDGLGDALAAAFDRTRLESEALAHELSAELDHSRAAFLTAVTHDLRTPLATIKATTGLLIDSDSSLEVGDRRELLQASHVELTRLEQLVSAVLELTRIRAGGMQPERTAVSLGDLVRSAVKRLGPAITGHRIDLDIGSEIPAAWVDPLMFERVLVNLLDNALRHGSDDGQIMVRASAGAELELRVIDHGPGIPVEDRERVFEEFVRLGPTARGDGSGLGLTITRAFVGANGGRVWYEETPGGGATFALTLPAEDLTAGDRDVMA